MQQQLELSLFDYAAEYQLIGWVLSNNELFSHVIYLKSEAFHYGFHTEIWDAMKALNKQGKEISPFTLRPLLKAAEEGLETVLTYLAKSVSESLLMVRPIEGANYLNDLYQKRKLFDGFYSINASDSVLTSASKIGRILQDISDDSGEDGFEDNIMVSDRIIKDMRDTKLPFSTGISLLDKAMDGGLYEGKSYGFAARKKVGKTALAATISANLNADGIKHLFICGEMSPKEIHQRVLARQAKIFPSAFRGEYGKTNNCEQKIVDVVKDASRNTLYKNAPGLTFDDLRRYATIAVEKHAVRGIIIDYWQLVGGRGKAQNTTEHLDEVAQWIANFGRAHNVWMITMAQLNQDDNTRNGEGIRLAFDQLYQIHRENLTQPHAWLEMMETRYTPWLNVGSKEYPMLSMNERGPFFEET